MFRGVTKIIDFKPSPQPSRSFMEIILQRELHVAARVTCRCRYPLYQDAGT